MTEDKQTTFEFESRPTIKGFPELHWTGKRPYRSTQYFPAQIKERHGSEVNGWINKIFWGDNLQVMSHLLKEYRGKVDLIYIDPPFDSKADYKKTIELKGKKVENDHSSFEEKQYGDIWTNDEYLQFMYERLILLRELLSNTGSIYLHCDYHKSHYLRIIMDDVFGNDNFRNELIWKRKAGNLGQVKQYGVSTDTILYYSKTSRYFFEQPLSKEGQEEYIKRFKHVDENGRLYRLSPIISPSYSPSLVYDYKGYQSPPNGWSLSREKMEQYDREGRLNFPKDKNHRIERKQFLDEWEGSPIQNLWTDIFVINPAAHERENYPTQKPEALLERIIKASSKSGDLIFDCFMGSGTTQAVAMKLGRRFIGADINLGAIQTTTKRLLGVAKELNSVQKTLESEDEADVKYTGFEVYNVNNYDIFRNPVEAKELILEAYQVQKYDSDSVYDGELDGWMVKLMPVNRIATKADLEGFVANLPYKTFEIRKADSPNSPVERIRFICMGHEPDLAAAFKAKVPNYKIDVEVVDVMRDSKDLHFKHDSDAKIVRDGDNLVIEEFYPFNLMQKLSWMEDDVTDWRQLVESVMIDWNYDGAVMEPSVRDITEKEELVKGVYPIPEDFGVIKIKITDLLSESYEEELRW